MLLFDVLKLEKLAGNDVNVFLKLFTLHEKNSLLPLYVKGSLYGSSFILNPRPLTKAPKNFEKAYLVQYIKLAGRRDLTLYKQFGVKYLPISYHPDLNIDVIKHNPLLKIKENNLYFKFEELI